MGASQRSALHGVLVAAMRGRAADSKWGVVESGMRTHWSGLTVDCVDPVRLAGFWGTLLNREAEPGLPGWMLLVSEHEHQPRINFQPVTEPKRGKVRIDMDVTVDDIDEAIQTVVGLGGRETGERHEYPEGTVVVLKDTEYNEFCIVQYRTSVC